LPILVLRSTLGGVADDAGRLVGEPDGRVGLVAVLSARSRGAEALESALGQQCVVGQ